MPDRVKIERAKYADLVSRVGRIVKMHRRGRALWGCCPFHAEKTPSFKVEDGRFYCFGCGAHGDPIDWVQLTEGRTFRESVEQLTGDANLHLTNCANLRSSKGTSIDRPSDDLRRIREARAIWSSGAPVTGTKAETYLRARGFDECGNPSLRFVPAYTYAPGVILPAMIAAMMSPEREIIAVQVTALDRSGERKAQVATPRKTFGAMGSGAVRLAAAGGVLGLAEGVETGLAGMALTRIPTWSCLGANRMHQVQIPRTVRELHIFADDDESGRAAADRTVEVNRAARRIVRLPPFGCGDWNDVLIGRVNGEIIEIPAVPK